MTNVFYVKNKAGRTVAASFLSYRGRCIPDPNVAKAQSAAIYTDADGGSVIGNGNPHAYFIVPSNYSIDKAIAFSNLVSSMLVCNGISAAYGLMIGAFVPNGSQDLQRTYPESDGKNPGDFIAEFTDSASFHFGFVAAYSGIGESSALSGGGLLNRFHHMTNRDVDTSGVDGNNPKNVRSIHAGASFATELQHRYGVHTHEFCYAPF